MNNCFSVGEWAVGTVIGILCFVAFVWLPHLIWLQHKINNIRRQPSND